MTALILCGVKELVKKRGVNSYDKNTSEKLLLSFNVSFLNIIADRMTEMELKSFGIFVDFLISSLHSNKHSVISLSLLGMSLHSIKSSETLLIEKIASSILYLLNSSEYLFEILTGDYGDSENFVNSKIQNILIDSTSNPNSMFVKKYAICRLSLWTMSAIVTRVHNTERFSSCFFWREDLTNVNEYVRIVFSLFTLLIHLDLSKSSLRLAHKQILQQLLAVHLSESEFLATCIANILTLPVSVYNSHRTTSQVKMYVLHMLESFIGSLQETPGFALIDKLCNSCPIIPALLTQLISGNRLLRSLSLQCLSSLRCSPSNSYQSVIAKVLDRSTDIRASREFTTRVLSLLAVSPVATGKRRSTRQTHVTDSHPLDPILMDLVNNSTPNHITSLFLSLLQSIDSRHIYPAMCTLLERCLGSRDSFGEYHSEIVNQLIDIYTPTIAPLLTKESKGTEIISQILGSDLKFIQTKLINKFTLEFFDSLPSISQNSFLSILFRIVTSESDLYLDSTKAATRECISGLTLNPAHITHILIYNAEIRLSTSDVVLTPSPAKKRKRSEVVCNGNSLPPQNANSILSSVLELILKCRLCNIEATIPLYFQILSVLLKWTEDVDVVTLDYNINLLFSLMTEALKSVSPLKLSVFESTFDVLQIIRTIQNSTNVHVQVQGYLLLSEAAKLMPDRIIHNIMPIFAFMGTSMVRNDDGYSFKVILQAIETLVPPLINIEGMERPVVSLICSVLQVFVDAHPHIPSHRRLALYSHLTDVLGASHYLYLLILLLLLKDNPEQSTVRARTSFAKSLLANFCMDTQLSAVFGMSQFLDRLISSTKSTKKTMDYNEDTIILQDLTNQQISEFATQIIQFESSYIHNKLFVKNVTAARNEAIAVDEYLCEVIELGLHYLEKSDDTIPNAPLIELIDNVLIILPLERFVDVFKRIPDQFEAPITSVRCE